MVASIDLSQKRKVKREHVAAAVGSFSDEGYMVTSIHLPQTQYARQRVAEAVGSVSDKG